MAEIVLENKSASLDSESVPSLNNDRINHILSNLLDLASGKFNITELQEIQHDSLDAIDRGLVMLGEQLEADKKQQQQFLIEKENLFKEIHHRVKNNLQIISSLLNLQMSEIVNEEARRAIRQSQLRIKSMALLHEMLYKSDDYSEIFLADYLDKLISLLVESIKGRDHEIALNLDVPPVKINLDIAVTIGLMVNEAVTNSLIHGLGDEGQIYVSLSKKEKMSYELKIGDNGSGFDPSTNRVGLGLQLIEILADQINGNLTRQLDKGVHYTVLFNTTPSGKPT